MSKERRAHKEVSPSLPLRYGPLRVVRRAGVEEGEGEERQAQAHAHRHVRVLPTARHKNGTRAQQSALMAYYGHRRLDQRVLTAVKCS